MQETNKSEVPVRTGVRALFPSCREVSHLQSLADGRPWSWARRMGLRLHLLVCGWCRRYGKHVRFLRGQAHEHGAAPPATPGLPADSRERMKRALK